MKSLEERIYRVAFFASCFLLGTTIGDASWIGTIFFMVAVFGFGAAAFFKSIEK
jgi:hypothetical protein